ncbi:hypothetical protein [Sanxia picorna-like virus 5]|uniref:hypothetical protein n=1 Tax=Sanxia picorna-like virus 5 TaxID=1923374 RepID=UPI000909BBB8|nr:hypothetical protein [Sanxia picorna-like virus 5]APG77486.1 hypothetical protein [Sanxia picorna-like virus 5]
MDKIVNLAYTTLLSFSSYAVRCISLAGEIIERIFYILYFAFCRMGENIDFYGRIFVRFVFNLRYESRCFYVAGGHIFSSQSGYAHSKYKRKNEREVSKILKEIGKLQEKKRSCKNGDAKKYYEPMQFLNKEKRRYESHSGSNVRPGKVPLPSDDEFRIFRIGLSVGFISSLWCAFFSSYIFPGMMSLHRRYWDDISKSNLVRRIERDIPRNLDFLDRARIDFSFLRLATKFDANNIENWTALIVGLATSTSTVNAGALLLTHFKTYYNKSVAVALADKFSSLFMRTYEPHSLQDMAGLWRMLSNDFNSLQKSPFFDKVLNVVSLVVCSGLCGSFDIDFKVSGFNVFSENLSKRLSSVSLTDMPGMILETVAYFLETGYMCYTQKSLKPILFTNPEAYAFEQKYLEFFRVIPLIGDGDWEAAGITISDFHILYDELYSYLHSLHSSLNKGFEKKVIWDRLVNMVKTKNDLDRKLNSGLLRRAPFVLAFCGPSSVGKTTVANIINVVAVKASGGTGDLTKKITWNENDDYFSNYKVDTETIVMDDLCNTKPLFIQSSPLAWLIKFNNNNPEYAVMAELESKGKLPIRPLTLVITTNVPDLLAQTYSNEPVSILRRLDMRVSVTVKEQFSLMNGGSGNLMLDPERARVYVDSLKGDEKIFPDMWNFTVEKAVAVKNPTGGTDRAEFRKVVWQNMILEDISLKVLADYTADAARNHANNQKSLVSKQTQLHDTINLCCVCNKLQVSCQCTYCDQAGEESSDAELDASGVIDITDQDFIGESSFWDFIPFPYREDIAMFVSYFASWRGLTDYVRLHWRQIFISFSLWAILSILRPLNLLTCMVWCMFIFHSILIYRFYLIYWQSRTRWFQLQSSAHRIASSPLFTCIVGAGTTYLMTRALGKILYGFIKFYRSFNGAIMTGQSALNPDGDDEYMKRRREPNLWYPKLPVVKLAKPSSRSKTTNWRDLNGKIAKNCVFIKSGTKVTGGFYVRTHLLAVPGHFISPDMELEIIPRVKYLDNKHSYRVRTNGDLVYKVPNSDIALVYAPGGCDKCDFTDYFPSSHLEGECVGSFTYRGADGELLLDRVRMKFGKVTTDVATFSGAEYEFNNFNTFKGLCMGALVGEMKPPCIAGFHLGGVTDTQYGASGTLLKTDIRNALAHFDVPGIIFPGGSSEIPTVMYESHLGDGPLTLDKPISPRCSSNFLPEGAIIDVLASCKGAVTNKSEVIVSHISGKVFEFTGVERTHGVAPMGPPLVRSWHNWSLGMQGFSDPAVGPFLDSVIRASVDYIQPLLPKFINILPLDLPTIINGLDGDKFLNRMPQNTSVGFPLSGKLSKFSTIVPAQEGHSVNFELSPEIMEVYEIYKTRYRAGERCYPIFRASLKDEPVKIGKLKVRVFQAAPVALKMLLREYFLPIASHLSMFPLISECAVGVNAFSNEWEEMHQHIVKFGDSRIVAGDYSAYDQRMPPSLTGAAFSILIELAEKAGYSPDDLTIMRAMVADVIYPLVAYNGTLVQFYGSNPSGHNLTVYINSIVNSLISRCAFFSMYPEHRDFRLAVSMITYGDDDIGSVSEAYGDFNCVTKSNYINYIGMKYTPPDKSGEHVPYMEISGVDFLKRKSVFNTHLDRHIGALDKASIYKSLHVRMRSSDISDEAWAGAVVDGALREFFAHGEQDYEIFRSQMVRVAEDCDFAVHSSNLNFSYKEMVEKVEPQIN